MSVVRNLIAWLTLADYQEAKKHATKQIVARLSRGNVVMQNGWFMDADDLAKASASGDIAISKLQTQVPASIVSR